MLDCLGLRRHSDHVHVDVPVSATSQFLDAVVVQAPVVREPGVAECEHAVEHITEITLDLFSRLVVHGPPRSRDVERQKAIERGRKREEQLRKRVLSEIA